MAMIGRVSAGAMLDAASGAIVRCLSTVAPAAAIGTMARTRMLGVFARAARQSDNGGNEDDMTPLQQLEAICEEIFDRWDNDQRSGKLLLALSGRLPNYRPDVDAVRAALSRE